MDIGGHVMTARCQPGPRREESKLLRGMAVRLGFRSGDPSDQQGDYHGADKHRQPVVRQNRAAKRDEGDPGEALEVANRVHMGGGAFLT